MKPAAKQNLTWGGKYAGWVAIIVTLTESLQDTVDLLRLSF
jgi:hypothetical protein